MDTPVPENPSGTAEPLHGRAGLGLYGDGGILALSRDALRQQFNTAVNLIVAGESENALKNDDENDNGELLIAAEFAHVYQPTLAILQALDVWLVALP